MKHILLFLMIVVACSAPKKSDNQLYNVINDYLTDTTSSKLPTESIKSISQISLVKQEFLFSPESKIKLIAEKLNEPDLQFIKEQYDKNQQFKTDSLSKFGYKIIPSSILNRKTITDSTTWLTIRSKYGSKLFSIDRPIFNKTGNMAYLRFEFWHGPKSKIGREIVMKKEDSQWNYESDGMLWVN